MIKILNHLDFDNALAIANLRKRISGLISEIDVNVAKTYFLENNEGKIAFGYYENNILISWLAIKLHESRLRGKFWVISFLFSKKFRNVFSFNNIEIKSLFQQVFAYTEQLEYYDYYYSVGRRIMHVYERQWKKVDFFVVGRYEWFTLETVPAGTKPETELYWVLMNQELKDDTVVIKKRSLKEYLRKSNLK
jgi:hypothetical protein